MTATVAGAVLAATGWLGPVRLLDYTVVRIIGTALAVTGIGMVAVAQSGMGTSWRPTVDYSERTELVRTGLFAVIRNPIFAFIIVAAAGMALMTPNVVALASVVALWLGIQLHVRRVEEPYLRWAHGDAYRDNTRPGSAAFCRAPAGCASRVRPWSRRSRCRSSGVRSPFHFDDMMRYHGPGSPVGVAVAFKAMQRAFDVLSPDEPPQRRSIVVRTAFRGPGGRDGFEAVTRAVTDGRFTVDRAPGAARARPAARGLHL